MNAAEAAALTERTNMRVVFEESCQRMYSSIMGDVRSRASEGMGNCWCVWIEATQDGVLGDARERVIVERLRREGYGVHKREQGAASYIITWCEDRAPWDPGRKAIDVVVAPTKAAVRALRRLIAA